MEIKVNCMFQARHSRFSITSCISPVSYPKTVSMKMGGGTTIKNITHRKINKTITKIGGQNCEQC